jgi:hypothetical protein
MEKLMRQLLNILIYAIITIGFVAFIIGTLVRAGGGVTSLDAGYVMLSAGCFSVVVGIVLAVLASRIAHLERRIEERK